MTLLRVLVRYSGPFLLVATLTGIILNGRHWSSAAARVPAIAGEVTGPEETVFNTANACEQLDIPDAPARAFRDDRGTVHLLATHRIARAMTGPNLNQLNHDCRVIYRSPQDPDPSHFQDNNWLYAFYSVPGDRIAALVHSEYDGEEIPKMCATPNNPNNCWWNTVTFAESRDGGATFVIPPAPNNLVAALPYRYEVGNQASAYGYNAPTNIVKTNGSYFALINDWPYKLQKYGPCLIRTSDVFSAGSWRAWDGVKFTIRFADPYREKIDDPAQHVCPPVYSGTADCLVQDASSGIFITTQSAPDSRFGGPPGFYMEASRDLVHWSKQTLLVSFSDLQVADGPGKWTYGYESLLDPTSADRNFSTLSQMPYLYYVRLDGNHPPYSRVLFRRRVKLRFPTVN